MSPLEVGCVNTVFGHDATCRHSAQTSDWVEVLTPYSTTPSNQFETETATLKASRGCWGRTARGGFGTVGSERLSTTQTYVSHVKVWLSVCLSVSLTQVLESVEGDGLANELEKSYEKLFRVLIARWMFEEGVRVIFSHAFVGTLVLVSFIYPFMNSMC